MPRRSKAKTGIRTQKKYLPNAFILNPYGSRRILQKLLTTNGFIEILQSTLSIANQGRLSKKTFYVILLLLNNKKLLLLGTSMIAALQGTVKEIHEQSLILNTGPIGFEVFLPNPTSYKVGSSIELYAHLHWNQEQGPTLFGFPTLEEKKVFLLANKCPGIGPRTALAMIQSLGAGQFVQAIAAEDINALSTIPGIGKKKAEQLAVQLKHQVAKLLESGTTFANTTLPDLQKISEVLNSLNYSRPEITLTLAHLRKTEIETISFDHLLRKALSHISKRA